MKLNKSLVIPLYRQVMDDLREQMDQGVCVAGDKIPSEAELSERYEVSRITIRRAIEELVGMGLLTKRQGKGTYVNPPKLSHKIVQYRDVHSFFDTCADSGRTASRNLLECNCVAVDEAARTYLGLAEDEAALHIRSIGLADGVPILLEDDYMSESEFAFLKDCDLSTISPFEEMKARNCRTPIGIDRCRLEVLRASSDLADLLDTAVAEPLYYIDTFLHDVSSNPLLVSRAYTVGSRFAFELA